MCANEDARSAIDLYTKSQQFYPSKQRGKRKQFSTNVSKKLFFYLDVSNENVFFSNNQILVSL